MSHLLLQDMATSCGVRCKIAKKKKICACFCSFASKTGAEKFGLNTPLKASGILLGESENHSLSG